MTLIVALYGILPITLFAQTPQSKPAPAIGKVSIDFGKAQITNGAWHLYGGVKMTSENYDLAGQDFQVYFAKGRPGASTLIRAVAEGSPAANTQVVGRFQNVLESQAYRVYADHAVYLPDDSRKGGGKISFTGHVQVIANSGFLNGPSRTQTESATVLLGAGADYPQLETGPAHTEFTPAQ